LLLFYGNFDATNGFARKPTYLACFKRYDAIAVSVYGVVAAGFGTFAGALGHTDLADNYLAGADFLATVYLNAKALANAVAGIFGGTACFNV
jgi:hypothetical protein